MNRISEICQCAALLVAFHITASLSSADDKPVRVALYNDKGAAGKGVPRITEQLGKVKDVKLTVVKGPDIAGGVLKDFDVVIFAGGSGHSESDGIGETGREEVRKFVSNGGGYVGICAGAYLACDGFSWGLKILNAKTPSPKWERGHGNLQIEYTKPATEVLAMPAGEKREVIYHNGPLLVPSKNPELPAFETLAWFRTEVAEHGTPPGIMVNSPAIVRAACGKGRVVVSSPHPEQTDGMENFIEHAVRWVAAKN